MVKQYPHTATFTIPGEPEVLANGDIKPSEDCCLRVQSPCRAEPSGDNGLIRSNGGIQVNFSWVVYLPASFPGVQIGADVEISDVKGFCIVKDTVKRFSGGQLNSRVWL